MTNESSSGLGQFVDSSLDRVVLDGVFVENQEVSALLVIPPSFIEQDLQ